MIPFIGHIQNTQIYTARKYISACLELSFPIALFIGEMIAFKEYGVSFLADERVLKLC